MNNFRKIAPIMIFVIALFLFFSTAPFIRCLTISNVKNPKQKFYSTNALNGFIISYTHSVNKGRVHDYYECLSDDTFVLTKTVFVSYGAGIPEPDETPGAIFSVTNEGYEISGLHRNLNQFVMAVGVIAEHSITINGRKKSEIFLKDLFLPQTSLLFKIKKVSILSYFKEGLRVALK